MAFTAAVQLQRAAKFIPRFSSGPLQAAKALAKLAETHAGCGSRAAAGAVLCLQVQLGKLRLVMLDLCCSLHRTALLGHMYPGQQAWCLSCRSSGNAAAASGSWGRRAWKKPGVHDGFALPTSHHLLLGSFSGLSVRSKYYAKTRDRNSDSAVDNTCGMQAARETACMAAAMAASNGNVCYFCITTDCACGSPWHAGSQHTLGKVLMECNPPHWHYGITAIAI
jgi:hypothetical protein